MRPTFLANFAGVGSIGAAAYLGSAGSIGAAGAVAIVGVLALAIAAHAHGFRLPSVGPIAVRRVAAPALALVIVTTAALSGVGGTVGTAQAAYFEGCQFSDSMSMAIFNSLGVDTGQDCTFWSPDVDISNVSETDAYTQGLAMHDKGANYRDTVNNTQETSTSAMWMEAKISIINSLNNNKSLSEAKTDAKAKVRGYTSKSLKQVLHYHSVEAEQISYMAYATGGSNTTGSTKVYAKEYPSSRHVIGSTANFYVVLPDGSNVTVSQVLLQDNGNQIPVRPGTTDLNVTHQNWSHGDIDIAGPFTYPLAIENADGSSTVDVYQQSEYSHIIETYYSQMDQVNSNIDAYADAVYSAFEAGEIDATGLAAASPTALAANASTDLNSTGYNGFAAAALAAANLDGDLNQSHVIRTDIDVDSYENGSKSTTTYTANLTGTLFYTGTDQPTLTTGQEYNPADFGGTYYLAVSSVEHADGNTTINKSDVGNYHDLDRNFTVVSATNVRTGEAVNTTTMEQRDFTSTNESRLQDEIEELKEIRDYYEEQVTSSGGGVSFDFGGTGTGVIVALAAVLVLFIMKP